MAPSHNTGDCLIRARKSAAICFLRIQDEDHFVHLHGAAQEVSGRARASQRNFSEPRVRPGSGSVIIHHFAIKSPFFMSLGACRLKRRILVLLLGASACLSFVCCGGYTKPGGGPPSGLTNRVLASQWSTSTTNFGSLIIVNGVTDFPARAGRISAGNSPGLMAVTPSLNIAASFDASS